MERIGIMSHAAKCKWNDSEAGYRECDCDGYHTWGELYEHRIELFRALTSFCALGSYTLHAPWRSKLHSDGTMFDGWFIAGICKIPGHQISYHIPIERWDDFAHCETLPKSPHWDEHTSDDVIERLRKL